MAASQGLQTALNYMREMSVKEGRVYHQFVPVVNDTTTIGEWGAPILDPANTTVLNDFVALLCKVLYTGVYNMIWDESPLAQLEGERMPLGKFIEDVYVNPAKARQFDVNDFAGLLHKYEAEVATQYLAVNSDKQYCVTVTRDKIRDAFTSWNNLEDMISGYINSLYNGAYYDRYNDTKALMTGAYIGNRAKIETVSAVTDEATGKALVKKIRAAYSKMKIPSTNFNAWDQVRGDGLKLKTWTRNDNIVVIISADVDANVSVDVLAKAFNMSETDFIGRVIVVDDFNVYDQNGDVAVDGSNIQAIIADRSWFKIKTQDFDMSDFWNPNNRTWQYYLNDVRMYQTSLFSNCLIFATAQPNVAATAVTATPETMTITAGDTAEIKAKLTPANSTAVITAASSATTYATVAVTNGKIIVTGVAAGSATITITATNADNSTVTDTVAVTVSAAE